MPLIVVVEREQRYVERIVEALSPQGWEVIGVEDRDTALKHRADETASLLIVNGEVPHAADLVAAFARSKGGPGAVVLVPEDADDGVHRLQADEVLQKPFTDQEIRLAVRRCLVGLSSPATQQATSEPAPPPEPSGPQRLTSQDLFGDMVTELESTFKFGADDQEEERSAEAVQESVQEVEVDEEPTETPQVVDLTAEEISEEPLEAVVEESGEEELTEAVERTSDEVVAEVEEEVEAPEAVTAEAAEPRGEKPSEAVAEPEAEVELEEPAEEQPEAEEEPAVAAVAEDDLEAVEEDLREAPPEPPEEPVEAAETARAAEPETTKKPPRPPRPPRDPAAALEERIRQAAEEGKRLAVSGRRSRAAGDDLGRSTDTLLEQALAGLDEKRPRRRRRPARATEEEVDDLVGSVVDDGEPEEDDETRTGGEPGDSSEAPALDLFERDERELEESEYRTRLKLIWAIILIVALGILAIVLIGRGGQETGTTQPPDVPAEEMTQPAAGPSGDGDAEGAELPSEGEEGPASDEETLEQELEAQRRQLQEEIAKSRATGEDGP